MSTKIKKQETKKEQVNPNKGFYIAISVMVVVVLVIVGVFVKEVIDDKKENTAIQQQINGGESSTTAQKENTASTSDESASVEFDKNAAVDKSDAKKVQFTMNDGQTFTMEVYPHVAPVTAENFLNLVESGFYSGLTFHRVIEGFMAQGGAYDPINQMNDPAESIYGEFSSNGFENNLSHQRGVVSMARTNEPNSASSQFFICYDDASFLDGEYAAFGYVTEGMETVDSFLSAGTDPYTNMPLKEVKIKEAKIID